jgi:hypothetical protein
MSADDAVPPVVVGRRGWEKESTLRERRANCSTRSVKGLRLKYSSCSSTRLASVGWAEEKVAFQSNPDARLASPATRIAGDRLRRSGFR